MRTAKTNRHGGREQRRDSNPRWSSVAHRKHSLEIFSSTVYANGIDTATAIDVTFASRPASASPSFEPLGVPIREIPKAIGVNGNFTRMNGLDDVTSASTQFCPGARGLDTDRLEDRLVANAPIFDRLEDGGNAGYRNSASRRKLHCEYEVAL